MWPTSRRSSRQFRTGKGVGWHEHDPCLFEGTERFFRPGYNAQPGSAWIPRSTAWWRSSRRGAHGGRRRLRPRRVDDPHGEGVSQVASSSASTTTRRRSRRAREARARRPACRRPRHFEVADGEGLSRAATTTSSRSSTACTTWAIRSAPPGTCAKRSQPDGTWMIVEPFAGDTLEDNLNPVGPRLLLGVDDDLHAGLAVAGGRPRARRAGRRSAPARGRDREAASRASAARPRRRSTWCSRRGLESQKASPTATYNVPSSLPCA